MDWEFTFTTCSRRELGDYEHTVYVHCSDKVTYAEALEQARTQLPLGQRDNIYSKYGVEWEIKSIEIYDCEPFFVTNDEEEEKLPSELYQDNYERLISEGYDPAIAEDMAAEILATIT